MYEFLFVFVVFVSIGISFQLRVHCSIATVTLYFQNATNHLQVIEWFPCLFFFRVAPWACTHAAPSITVYSISRCRQAADV